MPRLTDVWSPSRSRRTGLTARLPTNLPGVSFTAQGRAWFRQDVSAGTVLPLRAARAATLAGVYDISRTETERFGPEAVFAAEQAVAAHLSDWRPLMGSPVRVRAALSLDLTADDAAKAERFSESRRAAALDAALALDHINFLREVVLTSEDTARLWWLHRNLTGTEPATSWDIFGSVVRPLIRVADERPGHQAGTGAADDE